jgi:UDP-N-acetyl-D-glucosamine/UDP-N-acetyl-D-galactosamine dehydrogenase
VSAHPGPPVARRVAVVGLGYVGLPLAIAFGRRVPTLGLDVDPQRVKELSDGYDRNGEQSEESLRSARLDLTTDPGRLRAATAIIIAVPTPVDDHKRPDLDRLVEATRMVGAHMSAGVLVVYESTVYPDTTEGVCVPILEASSGLRAGVDFKVAYSPERTNPGDPEHSLERVVKIVAGQDAEALEAAAALYGLVAATGVHRAPDIRTAEAAKVIENVQRDLNIALMNELAILFHRLGIDTGAVLRAAGTKWNFLPFQPGLVGGHCIPVDPYYLTFKAEELGYHTEVILAGRRINDTMGAYVAQETVKLLIRGGGVVRGARVLILGFAFKENVRDVRNTRVLDLVRELESYGVEAVVHDPVADPERVAGAGVTTVPNPFEAGTRYDGIVIAVAHAAFRARDVSSYVNLLARGGGRGGVLVDVKSVLPRDAVLESGVLYWSL